jgi:uncharacterized membrane protein YbhN (UPF0104 family)
LLRHEFPCGQSVGDAGPPHPQANALLSNMHLSPVGAFVQSTHVPPCGPHAVSPVAAHSPLRQHDAPPHVPSFAPPHAPVHVLVLLHVGVVPLHALHVPPTGPHAPFPLPAWHCAPSQQPRAQTSPPAHADVHACVAPLHAVSGGQSSVVAQPHACAAPFATHACPCGDAAQLMHAPGAPQLDGELAQAALPSGVGAASVAASMGDAPSPVTEPSKPDGPSTVASCAASSLPASVAASDAPVESLKPDSLNPHAVATESIAASVAPAHLTARSCGDSPLLSRSVTSEATSRERCTGVASRFPSCTNVTWQEDMALEATHPLPVRGTAKSSPGVWLRWAACAVAVGVLARTLANADLGRALSLIEGAGPCVVVIFAPYVAALALDTAACRTLLGALDRKAPFLRLFGARLAGDAVAMSLPAGGIVVESVNPVLLQSRCGVPYGDAIAAMAAKKWLVMRAHAVYIALSVAVGFRFLNERSHAIVGTSGLAWMVLASALVPLSLSVALEASLARGSVASKLVRALRSIPSTRLRAWLSSREQAIAWTDARFSLIAKARGACAKGLAIYVATWLVESVDTLVILRVLGANVGFGEVLSFEAALSLVRSVAFFSPAGLGVQDLGYVAFLGSLGTPDAAAIAAAFVLLKRSKESVFVACGYAMLWAPRRRRETNRAPAVSTSRRLADTRRRSPARTPFRMQRARHSDRRRTNAR